MATKQLSITLEQDVLTEVEARAEERERSAVISRDLMRYYDSLRDARAALREKLSENEISLILDVTNGLFWGTGESDDITRRMLWAEVSDGIELNRLDQKWEIDGLALVAKVRALSAIELCALADACQRWWKRVGEGARKLKPEAALED